MGRGSYLGGSTLLYAGKSWSSNDDIETPAVAWGRHLRHLESLAKAELEQRRKALLALLVQIIDHADVLRTAAHRISNPKSPEERERHREIARKLAVDTCSMMSSFLDAVAKFDKPGPVIRRYANSVEISMKNISNILEMFDECEFLIDWHSAFNATYTLIDIKTKTRTEIEQFSVSIYIQWNYGMHPDLTREQMKGYIEITKLQYS